MGREPPYQYCDVKACYRHGVYSGRCAEHRIEELEAENQDLKKLNKNLERQFVKDTEKIRELESLLGGSRPGQVS